MASLTVTERELRRSLPLVMKNDIDAHNAIGGKGACVDGDGARVFPRMR